MSCTIVIPTLAGPWLEACLEAVVRLDPGPDRVIVVHSGPGASPGLPDGVELVRLGRRAGFAAATNAGIAAAGRETSSVAVLNDDATPDPGWLGRLGNALESDPGLAAVQGTVTDAEEVRIDGCGITLDRWGLPVQVDHGLRLSSEAGDGIAASTGPERPARPETVGSTRQLLGVSATAALLRRAALDDVMLSGEQVFDERLGSYHEDLDLALRLRRAGWRAAWASGARCRHLGSATGHQMRWRRPWWLLANRWQVLAANLTIGALMGSLPRLLRGEIRAIHTLVRDDLRAVPIAAGVLMCMPVLVARGWMRPSPGDRLRAFPEAGA